MSEPKNNSVSGKAATARCPMCGRPPDVSYRPFCSKRCADIDLSRWLSDAYVIKGASASDDGDEDGLAGPSPPRAGDDD